MEYSSSRRKKGIVPLVITWTDLEGILLSKVSETERDKYCIFSLTCRILKKSGTHRHREENGSYQGLAVGEVGRCSLRIQTYK